MTGITMRQWYFDEAHGHYDIDLGDSYVGGSRLSDHALPADCLLDYGNNRGTAPLRHLVAGLYGRDPSHIGITHGGQEALYLLYRTLLTAGDHAVIFTPGWQQAEPVLSRAGCRVDAVGTTADGRPDIAAALRRIGPRTRAVVLNSPCNPTGRKVTADGIKELAEALRGHGGHLILDEEYVADLGTDSWVGAYENAVSVSSVSKVYGVPGLRVGWMCGPPEVVDAAMQYKHFTTVTNSVVLEQLATGILERREEHVRRYRQLITDGLRTLEHWAGRHRGTLRMWQPEGTPYAWLHTPGLPSSLEFCREVLRRERVLLMPAEVFGTEHGLRLTFAREPDVLAEGLRRIDAVLAGHPTAAGSGTHAESREQQ
ncbi:pyridoxal phosphate-dependent aminotransferase [Streptomyces sp. DSM 41527]|uniref:Aminotransferase n=1 Tax=Streptomyces mooreae TaxID=3075523 RepID=A0ABU2T5R4_9ACTN|nr:pyridoxal phosphate-dependent aminotransferase [Streptomyces sp. DSM 41527]MDT0455675.1 pyridoxal phosphate-dependent aminotransferase [Streptomyces sp. DSM 41527]